MTSRPRAASTDAPASGQLTSAEADATVTLAYEWGQLKRLPRTGWLRAGVEHPESIAEHSLRAAMLAWAIAGLEGADPEHAATLALFHDSQETRTTDLDHVARNYLHATPNVEITAEQTAPLPRALASLLRGLVADYEGRASLEADCARDADKLEMLLQARAYADQGYTHLGPFIESALAALGTQSGRRLAEAALRVSPATWWESFTREVAPADPPETGAGNGSAGPARGAR